MTGYTVHTGSNEKFSSGWDNIFGGNKPTTGKSKTSDAEGAKPAKKISKPGKTGKQR
ncbi:MAG TPA: hypothetical protein VL132_19980 [Planctomycetaceae bacterium]|nr:hypothetical protein [Planctomycetaceae bacterium]